MRRKELGWFDDHDFLSGYPLIDEICVDSMRIGCTYVLGIVCTHLGSYTHVLPPVI